MTSTRRAAQPPASTVVGVDLGGTTIKGRLLAPDATMLAVVDRATPQDGAAVTRALLEVIAELIALADGPDGPDGPVVAIGVAAPGIVDDDAGVAVRSANLGWRDVPLRQLVVDSFELPAVIGQDVRLGAIAEWQLGHGSPDGLFAFTPIGTGIGMACVQAGRTLSGESWQAGELGHVVVRPDGERCPCGQRGCLERYASASAIARRYADSTGRTVSAADVAGAVRAGDRAAVDVWDEAVGALVAGLATATALLDPEVIVIGGGLAAAGQLLLEPVTTALAQQLAWRTAPRVELARLGVDAGCRGAGLAAWQLAEAL